MASLIPWNEFEAEYAKNFPERKGRASQIFSDGIGALIIKEKRGISDRPRVEQIRKNPYIQYFIGQSTYSNELPFDPSLLVHFRQRIGANLINKVNERTIEKILETTPSPPEKKRIRTKKMSHQIKEN
jgi:hypothetical protein